MAVTLNTSGQEKETQINKYHKQEVTGRCTNLDSQLECPISCSVFRKGPAFNRNCPIGASETATLNRRCTSEAHTVQSLTANDRFLRMYYSLGHAFSVALSQTTNVEMCIFLMNNVWAEGFPTVECLLEFSFVITFV